MKNFKNFISNNYPEITSNITLSEATNQIISFQVSKKLRNIVENEMERNEYTVEWGCYVCKKPININVKGLLNDEELNHEDFLCHEHKNEKVNMKISISWIRYENLFHKKLQSIIKAKQFNF